MKIRDGHVSNSSSSSFVVAFPKKPKTADDVKEFMFGEKDGVVKLDYDDQDLPLRDVAKRVFNDVRLKRAINATLKRITEEFTHQFHYYPPGSNIHCFGGDYDEDGGHWSPKRGPYCVSDDNLAKKFAKFIAEFEEKEDEIRAEEHEIIAKKLGEPIPYAYKGGEDFRTKKPYTEEQIKAYEAYTRKLKKFRETDPEYLAWDKRKWAFYNKKWKDETGLRKKIAKVDAKKFIKDNWSAFMFIVEYGDENGDGHMEHGEIFKNLPHVRISKH